MNLLKDGIENGGVLKTNLSRKITIDGHTEAYPVYKVKLDYLFYNDQNDRIATWISQYKADNNINKIDMSDISTYNDIIQEFIVKSNPEAIKITQANIELVDQREPGVVLADGRIIDGNRRFTCLRNLSKNSPRFNYFETVILEKNLENNSKQIKMLELMIQHGEESKVDYNPIDRLVGIYNDVIESKLLTVKEYAMSTNMTESEVNKEIEVAKLLVEFLETINAPKQFYIARDMGIDGPLRELYGVLRKINNDDEAENIKNSVFTNFLVQPHGDMTRFIRKIKTVVSSKYLTEFLDEQMDIAEKVLDKLPEVGQVTKAVIKEVFRTDEDTKEELKKSLEKAELKAKSSETRNRPTQILEKIENYLETIDINIFSKLNEEQISSILSQVDKIEESLKIIKDATNV
ncbi:hypothetical protein A500_14773 [Clostridium sartagoforme AAU1]|uniref:ParB/Sulfiredoxin domain-containing protein n=1 Tax=Clostridium sartagoforme AAU1 TaxID=1202534 RepID=R9BV83_9CLOT|nr:hypothetical protein [Clostridium sartagoforme]EOR21059.1 hypothetical protein A500_14773 [Clostridium sartagoforme AAU1]